MNAIHYLASLYAFLIFMGLCTNSLIVLTTIRTKTLHSTCNILIAFCALSDILHQIGHLSKIIPIFEGTTEISSYTCSISQIVPNFGLSAGVILVFLISIDRLLSVHFSPSFIHKNSHFILMCHIIAIIAYASLQYSFAIIYFEESPPEIYHGKGKELWGMTSLSVIILSIIVYYVVWRELKNTGVRAGLSHTRRVFRSVFAVMCTLILGWLLTMTIIVIDRFVLDLEGRAMYIGEEVAGIPANTALTLNFFVLYNTSVEYRNAFRRQLRTIPFIRRCLPNNKASSVCFIRKNSAIPRETIGTLAGTNEIGCTILCNNTINCEATVLSNSKTQCYLLRKESVEGTACGTIFSSLVKTVTGCPVKTKTRIDSGYKNGPCSAMSDVYSTPKTDETFYPCGDVTVIPYGLGHVAFDFVQYDGTRLTLENNINAALNTFLIPYDDLCFVPEWDADFGSWYFDLDKKYYVMYGTCITPPLTQTAECSCVGSATPVDSAIPDGYISAGRSTKDKVPPCASVYIYIRATRIPEPDGTYSSVKKSENRIVRCAMGKWLHITHTVNTYLNTYFVDAQTCLTKSSG